MELNWESFYKSLKSEIFDKRATGKLFANSDVQYYNENVSKLEASLAVIQSSPMEYEV